MGHRLDDPLSLVLPQSDRESRFRQDVLRDLASAGDEEVRRAYVSALGRTFRAGFPERMRLGVTSLRRLADEMQRRGLPAFLWTEEIRERSGMAAQAWFN